MTERQKATLLAALQYWIREGQYSAGHEQDIATASGKFDALNENEIEQLVADLDLR